MFWRLAAFKLVFTLTGRVKCLWILPLITSLTNSGIDFEILKGDGDTESEINVRMMSHSNANSLQWLHLVTLVPPPGCAPKLNPFSHISEGPKEISVVDFRRQTLVVFTIVRVSIQVFNSRHLT